MSDVLHVARHDLQDADEMLKRRRICSELLLARLCRFHPDDARQLLKGMLPIARDDTEQPLTKIIVQKVVITAPEPRERGEVKPKVIPLPVEQCENIARPTVKQVMDEVASFYEISPNDMRSECRQAFIVKPRQVAMYLSRELTLNSFPQIGRLFGDRDHTTVLYAWCKIAAMTGSTRGDYVETHTKLKYIATFQPDERLKDEIEIVKLRLRQALLNNNPETANATSLSIAKH